MAGSWDSGSSGCVWCDVAVPRIWRFARLGIDEAGWRGASLCLADQGHQIGFETGAILGGVAQ